MGIKEKIEFAKDTLKLGLATPPTMHELLTFFVMLILLLLLLILYHYTTIQAQVRLKSRCYKEKQKAVLGGKYVVVASNKYNDPIYRVTYDMANKQNTVECACNPGEFGITIPNINTFYIRTKRTYPIKDKVCSCDKLIYEAGDNIYYSGYPDLVRYMQNPRDTSFFNNYI